MGISERGKKIACCGMLGALVLAACQMTWPLAAAWPLQAPGNLRLWIFSFVLWSADFERGDASQWYFPAVTAGGNEGGGKLNSGAADSVASTDHAHTGRWGLKMGTVAPPESGTRMFRWREPNIFPHLYYTVWYYFPQNYSVGTYWNILQWKSKRSASQNDPFFVLGVQNRSDGSMYFDLYDWQSRRSYSQAVKNVPVQQWFNVQAYYECAGDETGHVTVWQDGTPLFDLAGVQTRYPDGDCAWSVNNYSDSIRPSPAVIYIDDAAICWRIALPVPFAGAGVASPPREAPQVP